MPLTTPSLLSRATRLVEAVSKSPYWKDTAIFVGEDDAQNEPDHVDAHRSTVFVVRLHQ
jgi:hypothetical protein